MNQKEHISISDSPSPASVPARVLADVLCHHLALDQQVLLRLFARYDSGELNNAKFAALLKSFSLELPRRKRVVVEAIATNIESGKSFMESLDSLKSAKHGAPANFHLMKQALESSQEQDLLPEFLQSVSDYSVSRRPLVVRYHDTLRKKLTRLAVKSFIILQLITFLCLFIVPEFLKMFAEFGVELPAAMLLFMVFADRVVKFWFIFPILFFIVFYKFLLPRTWSYWLRRVIAKFSPWSWLQRPLSRHQRRKLSLALSGMQANAVSAGSPKLQRKEKSALKIAHSADVKTWLLSHNVQADEQRHILWKNRLVDAFVLGWNLLLACLVAWIAYSVVASLLAITESLL